MVNSFVRNYVVEMICNIQSYTFEIIIISFMFVINISQQLKLYTYVNNIIVSLYKMYLPFI